MKWASAMASVLYHFQIIECSNSFPAFGVFTLFFLFLSRLVVLVVCVLYCNLVATLYAGIWRDPNPCYTKLKYRNNTTLQPTVFAQLGIFSLQWIEYGLLGLGILGAYKCIWCITRLWCEQPCSHICCMYVEDYKQSYQCVRCKLIDKLSLSLW